MTFSRLTLFAAPVALALVACGPNAEHQRNDSTVVALSTQRAQLATQLSAQKDSLTTLVLQSDEFISHIDSSMSKVKGLPRESRKNAQLDPLARQIENRKLLMARVDALVDRARATASALAKSNSANTQLRTQLASDESMINELGATIKRQSANIDALSLRVDSLKSTSQQLASNLASTKATLAISDS
jgi:predicted RNase H-like nuclease (RuvC/YqgF family)